MRRPRFNALDVLVFALAKGFALPAERGAAGLVQREQAAGVRERLQIGQFDPATAAHQRLLAEQLREFAEFGRITPVEG